MQQHHIPVLLHEVLEGLQCAQKGVYLDCTVGCGGHAAAILACHPENRVIGIDRDSAALQIARQRLQPFEDRVVLYHERFEQVDLVLQSADIQNQIEPYVDGILCDLGVSSLQLDDAERGFSFQHTGWLDMRMNQHEPEISSTRTAYEVVNTYAAKDLADLFFRYGEERHARRIARRIVEARSQQPIETTTQLADLVARAIPKRFHPQGIHPATRVFQAIRIEVNEELESLGSAIERLVRFLRPDRRIGVIAFHSLEDRIVKRTYVKLAKGCQCPPDFPVCVCGRQPAVQIISKKPIRASREEYAHNPRSRSAKFRIAQKI
ncbi:16S rRNA (cytosine(1402)-N(4))-methyltransferase RsmH [candidate division KSB3 bacterium]|uniref:Ribosomal RNA small subunit methyltransferase H n=1 Tax=candidate division KSB3 bacterium TaxID=2044937 RepID=A0A9D5Q4U4_9BACT|nr:16S rRNA (cytosine(1402)-N(4))-methyltransferase RsmH [candidate division KSB3 bacterium]MBD3324074.1 16S rRNA (cytosine(1402)-N(4))-methyltransferase RsmH [candidate division KSB3 bacterium]